MTNGQNSHGCRTMTAGGAAELQSEVTTSSFPLIILVRQTSPPPPQTISHWTCSQLNGGPREQHKRMFSCSCLYRIRRGGSSFAFVLSVHRTSLTKFLFFYYFYCRPDCLNICCSRFFLISLNFCRIQRKRVQHEIFSPAYVMMKTCLRVNEWWF